MNPFRHFLLITLILSATVMCAQSSGQAPPCQSAPYKQFDWWVGKWDVYAGDRKVGENTIERILGGCVLMENWVGYGGSKGHSFNIYNQASKSWEQTWVDNTGLVVYFKGNYVAAENMMRFTATGADSTQYQMRFWKKEDGTILQRWEGSAKGQPLRVLFEGLYRRQEEKADD